MLAGQMLALSREAPRLAESERIAAVQAVTGLLAAGVGHAADAKVPVAQAMRDATLAAVKRYIDAMLLSDGLRPDAICRIFGLSRATLYRLFEPEGGIAAYVQARRLREAVSLLVSPLHRHLRLEDLASRHGFSSGAAFIRAFRRAFDMTPGEMKAMALGLHGRESGDADRWAKDAASANIAWIRALAG
jgi:AraC-like DNA-binding protein